MIPAGRIKFNNQDIPPFVIVSQVHTSILPPINQITLEVPGKSGCVDFGNRFSNRVFYVDYGIIAKSKQELRAKVRELAQWLYYDQAKPLAFPDEPDKYYMAKLTGDTDLTETMRIGKGTISFLCTDPFAYAVRQREAKFTHGEVTIHNRGGMETYPQIELVIKHPSSELSINHGENSLYFGQPTPVDAPPPVPKRSLIFQDTCYSVAGWTSGVGVDGGVVTGSLQSTGNYIRVADYGAMDGNLWHGPAGVKAFNKQLQDFTLEVEVGFKSIYAYQVGRVEIYLLDINNARIGKIAVLDPTMHSINTRLEARLGDLSGGYYFVNTDVARGKYTQLNGKLTLKRRRECWTFEIARKIDGNLLDTWSTRYFDHEHRYRAKLAGIQLHIGACGKYQPYSTAYVSDIKVYQENNIDLTKRVPYIFEAGDKLYIDSESGTVLKNGEPFYHHLNPNSSFIKLDKGANNISIYPPVDQGKISFRERWF